MDNPYTPKNVMFDIGDLISHKEFGDLIIIDTKYNDKYPRNNSYIARNPQTCALYEYYPYESWFKKINITIDV